MKKESDFNASATIDGFQLQISKQQSECEEKLATAVQNGKLNKPSGSASGADNLSVEDAYTLIIDSLEESKAIDVQAIDISTKSSIGDYMIIASGRSNRHVGAIADHLLRAIKNAGAGVAKVEGQSSSDWVLIDIGDIIVHLFRPEVREFYNLEKMWMLDEAPKHSSGK